MYKSHFDLEHVIKSDSNQFNFFKITEKNNFNKNRNKQYIRIRWNFTNTYPQSFELMHLGRLILIGDNLIV